MKKNKYLVFVNDKDGIFYNKDDKEKKFSLMLEKVKAYSIEEAYELMQDIIYIIYVLKIPDKHLLKKFKLEKF